MWGSEREAGCWAWVTQRKNMYPRGRRYQDWKCHHAFKVATPSRMGTLLLVLERGNTERTLASWARGCHRLLQPTGSWVLQQEKQGRPPSRGGQRTTVQKMSMEHQEFMRTWWIQGSSREDSNRLHSEKRIQCRQRAVRKERKARTLTGVSKRAISCLFSLFTVLVCLSLSHTGEEHWRTQTREWFKLIMVNWLELNSWFNTEECQWDWLPTGLCIWSGQEGFPLWVGKIGCSLLV